MNTFKVGDKVYFPERFKNIIALEEHLDSQYPVSIMGTNVFDRFTLQGLSNVESILPSIFHATEENHRKLSELYGIEFEKPSAKPTSKDIIKAKLNKSTEPVPCWVSNIPNCTQPTRKDVWAFIKEVDTDPSSEIPFLAATGNWWIHATPFDPTTLQPITELSKGEYYD